MNLEIIGFNLNEALKGLENLKRKLDGESEEGLKVELEEAIWHLIATWEMRNMTFGEALSMQPEAFRDMGGFKGLKRMGVTPDI